MKIKLLWTLYDCVWISTDKEFMSVFQHAATVSLYHAITPRLHLTKKIRALRCGCYRFMDIPDDTYQSLAPHPTESFASNIEARSRKPSASYRRY